MGGRPHWGLGWSRPHGALAAAKCGMCPSWGGLVGGEMGPLLEVVLLGTGSSWPNPDRYHTSIAVRYEGEIILFDCGEAAQIRLQQAGLSAFKINKIFITHLHGDHFYGLPGLVYSLSMARRDSPLTIYGPKGVGDLKKLLEVGYNFMTFKINFKEIKPGVVLETDKYQIKAVEVEHEIPALAYSFQEKDMIKVRKEKIKGIKTGPWVQEVMKGKTVVVNGKKIGPEILHKNPGRKIVYSGDCRPSPKLLELAKGADLLIHEATYSEEDSEKAEDRYHSTALEAAQIAKKAEAKKLVLTHYSRKLKSPQTLVKEAKKVFQNSAAGKDLMVLKV